MLPLCSGSRQGVAIESCFANGFVLVFLVLFTQPLSPGSNESGLGEGFVRGLHP